MSPLFHFFEIFTSGRYHRDMKALKILASNSKHLRIYGIFKKWLIGVPEVWQMQDLPVDVVGVNTL